MSSVTYGYAAPFIETVEREYTDPETGETVTRTDERERYPFDLFVRKFKPLSESADTYRVWMRVTLTEMGVWLLTHDAATVAQAVTERFATPAWADSDAVVTLQQQAAAIRGGAVTVGDVTQLLSTDADVTVESVVSDGDDLLITGTVTTSEPVVELSLDKAVVELEVA